MNLNIIMTKSYWDNKKTTYLQFKAQKKRQPNRKRWTDKKFVEKIIYGGVDKNYSEGKSRL